MAERSMARQLACVERELRMRRSAYPRWVASGKMTQGKADDEIADMEAVLATLRDVAGRMQPDLLAG